MKQSKTCGFQYATTTGNRYNKEINLVIEKLLITLDEAKLLWNKYFQDLKQTLENGDSAEMIIWFNMKDRHDFSESLYHISNHAKIIDGYVTETNGETFPENIKIIKK